MALLSLPQALMVLSLESNGAIRGQERLAYSLAGACLAELNIRGRIRVDGERSAGLLRVAGHKVYIDSDEPTNLRSCDYMLERIAEKEEQAPQRCIQQVFRKTQPLVLEELLSGGVVRRKMERSMGLFPVARYPLTRGAPKEELTRGLIGVIRGESVPTERTAALTVFADSAGLLRRLVPEMDKQERKARVKELGEGQGPYSPTAIVLETVTALSIGMYLGAFVSGT